MQESAQLCSLCEDILTAQDPESRKKARSLLGDLLIQEGALLAPEVLDLVDDVYQQEPRRPLRTPADELPGASWYASPHPSSTKVAVWRGDITHLKVDAVVNAANEQGVGCFVPRHMCIDNVLHRAAGPRLRHECRAKMLSRHSLTSGSPPLLTSGYHLNAANVLHVTGPQLMQGASPSAEDEAKLAACYTGCLESSRQAGLRSIAFCCISTGLFGYPSDAAASVALTTVRNWLSVADNGDAFDFIIFDVFTDLDAKVYGSLAPSVFEPTAVSAKCGDCDAAPPTAAAGAPLPTADRNLLAATKWLVEADAVLVCAGAGMSVKPGEMVYSSEADFKTHVP